MIESKELLTICEDKNIQITLEDILTNLETPYCKDCLKNKGLKISSIYRRDTGEFVCPNCGLVATLF